MKTFFPIFCPDSDFSTKLWFFRLNYIFFDQIMNRFEADGQRRSTKMSKNLASLIHAVLASTSNSTDDWIKQQIFATHSSGYSEAMDAVTMLPQSPPCTKYLESPRRDISFLKMRAVTTASTPAFEKSSITRLIVICHNDNNNNTIFFNNTNNSNNSAGTTGSMFYRDICFFPQVELEKVDGVPCLLGASENAKPGNEGTTTSKAMLSLASFSMGMTFKNSRKDPGHPWISIRGITVTSAALGRVGVLRIKWIFKPLRNFQPSYFSLLASRTQKFDTRHTAFIHSISKNLLYVFQFVKQLTLYLSRKVRIRVDFRKRLIKIKLSSPVLHNVLECSEVHAVGVCGSF